MTIIEKRGVVVFLDALGVSKYKQIAEFLKLCENMETLDGESKYIWAKWKLQWAQEGVTLPDPEIFTLQDSMFACFPEPDRNIEGTLHNFFVAQSWLMQAMEMSIAKKLFFRGAISNGQYIMNESEKGIQILGKPVNDAVEYEKFGDWIGVIQTPNFHLDYILAMRTYAKINHKPISEFEQDFLRFYVKYDVPLTNKRGNREFYVVNWPTMVKKSKAEDEIRTALSEGKRSADESNKQKYDNTIRFLDFCKENGYFL